VTSPAGGGSASRRDSGGVSGTESEPLVDVRADIGGLGGMPFAAGVSGASLVLPSNEASRRGQRRACRTRAGACGPVDVYCAIGRRAYGRESSARAATTGYQLTARTMARAEADTAGLAGAGAATAGLSLRTQRLPPLSPSPERRIAVPASHRRRWQRRGGADVTRSTWNAS
jgi:hypothetical protein